MSDFDHDRTECPTCGGDIYYEPRIRAGTRYEATSGWSCTECSWSKIDPESGETRHPPRQIEVEDLEGETCANCGGSNFEAGYVKEESDDPRLDFETSPAIFCAECGILAFPNPSKGLYSAVDE